MKRKVVTFLYRINFNELMDYEAFTFLGLSATCLGLLLAGRTWVGRRTARIFAEDPSQEGKRLEEIIARTTSIGNLERLYQSEKGYQDQQGRKIEVASVSQQVMNIDPSESLYRNQNHLTNKLNQLAEEGKRFQADFFSLTDPAQVNRYLVYGISFHQRKSA